MRFFRRKIRVLLQKRLKIDRFDVGAAFIIVFATSIRIVLAALGWPPTNSDEGTMALMANNIAYHGAWPQIYYGQKYMGTLEAYLGAVFYHILGGPSLFALRLGVILLTMLFFVALYSLSRLLYSKALGLIGLAILSFGSIPMLTRQMIATGGTTQTLLFGTLAFLIASWLAMTYHSRSDGQQSRVWRFDRRGWLYASWGLVVGLGVWSDMIVLPFLAMSGLLILLFCWREILSYSIILLACLLIGMLPLLIFDFANGQNAWQVLLGLTQGTGAAAPRTLPGIWHNIIGTVQVSIPTATGEPVCPVVELRFLGDNAPHIWQCTLAHSSWSLGYLFFLGWTLTLVVRQIRNVQTGQKNDGLVESQYERARTMAHLFLPGTAILTLAVYIMSSGPVDQPGFHARYLAGLLIATPALLSPLWNIASQKKGTLIDPLLTMQRQSKRYASRALLAAIIVVFLVGTLQAFSEVSLAQAQQRQRTQLVTFLLQQDIKHVYTDYWTCNSLAFESQEQIICAVLEKSMRSTHNRVPGYYDTVRQDAYAAYLFLRNDRDLPVEYQDLPPFERLVVHYGPQKFERLEYAGYVIYKPLEPVHILPKPKKKH